MPAVRPDPADVAHLRAQLDALDESLLGIVAQRCKLARELGEVKQSVGLPLRDPVREAAVVRRAATIARAHGVHDERVRQLFSVLIEMSRDVQSKQRT